MGVGGGGTGRALTLDVERPLPTRQPSNIPALRARLTGANLALPVRYVAQDWER